MRHPTRRRSRSRFGVAPRPKKSWRPSSLSCLRRTPPRLKRSKPTTGRVPLLGCRIAVVCGLRFVATWVGAVSADNASPPTTSRASCPETPRIPGAFLVSSPGIVAAFWRHFNENVHSGTSRHPHGGHKCPPKVLQTQRCSAFDNVKATLCVRPESPTQGNGESGSCDSVFGSLNRWVRGGRLYSASHPLPLRWVCRIGPSGSAAGSKEKNLRGLSFELVALPSRRQLSGPANGQSDYFDERLATSD